MSPQSLSTLRPVYVIGIRLHRYQRKTDTSFVELAPAAVLAALPDGGVPWNSIEAAYTGTTRLGMAVTQPVLRHLGVTGIPMTQVMTPVENASASSSSAFRCAIRDVAAGFADVVLAAGGDKVGPSSRAQTLTVIAEYDDGIVIPPVLFRRLRRAWRCAGELRTAVYSS